MAAVTGFQRMLLAQKSDARAADTLGKPQEGVALRAMIQKPATVSDADWPHYLEARDNRLALLNRRLGERRSLYAAIRDDPIAELHRLIDRGAA